MARLSKEQLGDRGRFVFKQEEVELEELGGGTVLVRSPSVGQRDDLAKELPDKAKDWQLIDVAKVFATVVVDPKLTAEEAMLFLNDWPSSALDKIIDKYAEMTGGKEEKQGAAQDFPSS